MRLRTIILLCGLFAASHVPAQEATRIQQQIDQLVRDPDLRGSDLSVTVIDLASSAVVASHQSRKPLIPASSLKVLTTATALAILGPDHTFHTDLSYDGTITADGHLQGNLYLTGRGDPTLGSDQMDGVPGREEILDRWLKAIQEAGIRSVSGAVLVDDSWFENTPVSPNWSWNDIGNYYGAGAWALNWHENFYYLRFQQNWKLGSRPGLRGTVPEIEGLTFENDVVTAGSRTGDNAYIFGRAYTYFREVSGSIPAGSGLFVIKGSIPDPPLQAARSLKKQLEENGIAVGGVAGRMRHAATQQNLLLRIHSPSLDRIVERANLESVNVYCEVLLRVIGKQWLGIGSREAGIAAIRQVWEDRGISWEDVVIDDGSGLSRETRISSLQLAASLRKAWLDEKLRPTLERSLPLAGRSGTLRSYLKGTAAEGRLRAKTGSMRGVRSYTGIATDRRGRQFTFSIIINDYTCSSYQVRQKLSSLMQVLCE